MAVEHIIKHWCDVCIQSDTYVDGRTVTVSFDGRKPKEIDLCAEHEDQFVEPLRALLGEEGRKPDQEPQGALFGAEEDAEASQKKWPCPIKGCAYKGRRGNMREHLRKHHDTTLVEAEKELGHTIEGEPFNFTCPECGGGFTHGQGLAAHRRNEHGVKAE